MHSSLVPFLHQLQIQRSQAGECTPWGVNSEPGPRFQQALQDQQASGFLVEVMHVQHVLSFQKWGEVPEPSPQASLVTPCPQFSLSCLRHLPEQRCGGPFQGNSVKSSRDTCPQCLHYTLRQLLILGSQDPGGLGCNRASDNNPIHLWLFCGSRQGWDGENQGLLTYSTGGRCTWPGCHAPAPLLA